MKVRIKGLIEDCTNEEYGLHDGVELEVISHSHGSYLVVTPCGKRECYVYSEEVDVIKE